MSLKLVCAKPVDLKMINELMRSSKAHWGYDPAFMQKFMSLFQMTASYLDKNITKLLYDKQSSIKAEQGLIGFFSLSFDSNNELELDNFFISPDYIGHGFGKILWQYVLIEVRHLKKSEFILWSDPGAEGFYEKMGCQKIGTKPSPMMPNRHPVIFKYSIETLC